jgi:hypothetical protein
LHARPQVLQLVAEELGDSALGLEARDMDAGDPRQSFHRPSPFLGLRRLVDADQGGDLQLEPAGEGFGAAAAARAEILQPVADQPGRVADILLEVGFQVLEMPVAERAAEAADHGLADPGLLRDSGRGLEGQGGKVGEHIAGDRLFRLGGLGEAGGQALANRAAHGPVGPPWGWLDWFSLASFLKPSQLISIF